MGLPSALLCRELWRLGYRRTAWSPGAAALAAAVAVISTGKEVIYALQWTIGRVALAPVLLTPILPLRVVVCPAIIGMLVWGASATLRRRREARATTQRVDDIRNMGFWLLSLQWLPALVNGAILIELFPSLPVSNSEFEPSAFHLPLTAVPFVEANLWIKLVPMFAIAFFVFSPSGLAVALPCRQIWRLGNRRAAWVVGAAAALTNAALPVRAIEGFLLVSPPGFSRTAGHVAGTLHYFAQMQPADTPLTWPV